MHYLIVPKGCNNSTFNKRLVASLICMHGLLNVSGLVIKRYIMVCVMYDFWYFLLIPLMHHRFCVGGRGGGGGGCVPGVG